MSGTGSLIKSANREMQPSSGYKHFKETTSHVCCCFVSPMKKKNKKNPKKTKPTYLRCPYLQPLFRLNSFPKGAEPEPRRLPPRGQFHGARVHQRGPVCNVSIICLFNCRSH